MSLLEQYGSWNRDRITKKLQTENPDVPGIWLPYSEKGINQVGTRDYVSRLLEQTPDKDLGRRALKLHTAVSAGILAMSILGGTYIGNKQEALAKDTTVSSVKPTK